MSARLKAIRADQVQAPGELFRCDQYACIISAGICVQRQRMLRQIRRGAVKKPVHEYCASGECRQGKAIVIALGRAGEAIEEKTVFAGLALGKRR